MNCNVNEKGAHTLEPVRSGFIAIWLGQGTTLSRVISYKIGIIFNCWIYKIFYLFYWTIINQVRWCLFNALAVTITELILNSYHYLHVSLCYRSNNNNNKKDEVWCTPTESSQLCWDENHYSVKLNNSG